MRKLWVLLVLALFLSGCASYKFQRGESPYDKGYVVAREGKVIPDYTVGRNNTVPDMSLAKKRFKERRDTVEYYYTKMDLMENRFKELVLNPAFLIVKVVTGIFRLPFIAYSDYQYDHDPKYKAIVDKEEQENEAKEALRIKDLREKLNSYIEKSLSKEPFAAVESTTETPKEVSQPPQPRDGSEIKEAVNVAQTQATPDINQPEQSKPPVQEPPKEIVNAEPAQTTQPVIPEIVKQEPLNEIKPVEQIPPPAAPEPARQLSVSDLAEEEGPINEMPQERSIEPVIQIPPQPVSEGIKAVIVAKPSKGYSPLKVKFNGQQSHSRHGRIVSYYWEFGDGDNSNKPTPINTYWSSSFGAKKFNVILTVKDDKGNTASESAVVEVLNK